MIHFCGGPDDVFAALAFVGQYLDHIISGVRFALNYFRR
jgi:hypothetical protein